MTSALFFTTSSYTMLVCRTRIVHGFSLLSSLPLLSRSFLHHSHSTTEVDASFQERTMVFTFPVGIIMLKPQVSTPGHPINVICHYMPRTQPCWFCRAFTCSLRNSTRYSSASLKSTSLLPVPEFIPCLAPQLFSFIDKLEITNFQMVVTSILGCGYWTRRCRFFHWLQKCKYYHVTEVFRYSRAALQLMPAENTKTCALMFLTK